MSQQPDFGSGNNRISPGYSKIYGRTAWPFSPGRARHGFRDELVVRAVVMSFGQKIAQGVPEEVQRNEAVLDAYLGSIA